MAAAEHRVGANGAFEPMLMLSLDPATITDRRYPLLFQTGETAYGSPIVDAQHPHNFIMGLGFHYARGWAKTPFSKPTSRRWAIRRWARGLSAPGLGHGTAGGPISHHWQDSTHIADEVVTVGISHKQVPAGSQRISWSRAGREPLDHPDRRHRFLVGAAVVLSRPELGGAGIRRAGSRIRKRWSRATRSAPRLRSHTLGRWRAELVVDPDLGTHPQHGHPARTELIPGGVGAADNGGTS